MRLNLIYDDSAGDELNVIFDNYSGQNKNIPVLKFNSLKHKYYKDNIFTIEKLVEALNVSKSVMVVLTVPSNFWDYNGLLNEMYKDISGKIKIDHIFYCSSKNPLVMTLNLRKSNLAEHMVVAHNAQYYPQKSSDVTMQEKTLSLSKHAIHKD